MPARLRASSGLQAGDEIVEGLEAGPRIPDKPKRRVVGTTRGEAFDRGGREPEVCLEMSERDHRCAGCDGVAIWLAVGAVPANLDPDRERVGHVDAGWALVRGLHIDLVAHVARVVDPEAD